ncbi:MAG TPA: creatininase family protein [Firmicutes bacterium]|nr:creatininase family protein [Bacillota bacterium]
MPNAANESGGRSRPAAEVQYELMYGRDAMAAIRSYPVGYLPIGCLERHGDHLTMGLDVLKAHKICCAAARAIGGVVFPPHYYAGIHHMTTEQLRKYTGEWGNIYTDRTAEDHLVDVIDQLAMTGIKVLVLYSGHYPRCQVEMIKNIGERFAAQGTPKVIPFCECLILEGDHAGISETSFMLYLDDTLVNMSRISEVNYQDHGWTEQNAPEKATKSKGESDVRKIIAHLEEQIRQALSGD